MPARIENFCTDAINVFQVGTLRELGFKTRVALTNKSSDCIGWRTSYHVSATIHTPGREVRRLSDLFVLKPDEIKSVDCDSVLESKDLDSVIIFHLIPDRYHGLSHADVSREEIISLKSVQDHYVEYFRSDGFSSGVLFQGGAFNYSKLGKNWSTIIQSPKVHSSGSLNTYMQLINAGFDSHYSSEAVVKCCLVDGKGEIIRSWTETVPPFSVRLVNLSDKLNPDSGSFCVAYALCANVTLVPLTISYDTVSKCLAVEHSLPPYYYADGFVGKLRFDTLASLAQSRLFSREV